MRPGFVPGIALRGMECRVHRLRRGDGDGKDLKKHSDKVEETRKVEW